MNRSASLVATERPKVPKSAQEFFNLPDTILLHGEIVVGKVGIGEISDGEVSVGKLAVGEIVLGKLWLGKLCWGSYDWGNCVGEVVTGEIVLGKLWPGKFSNTHFCVILENSFFSEKNWILRVKFKGTVGVI